MEAPPNTYIDTLEELVRKVREFEDRLSTMVWLAALNKSHTKTKYEHDVSECFNEVVEEYGRTEHPDHNKVILETLRTKLMAFQNAVMYIRQFTLIHGQLSRSSASTSRSRSPLTRSHTTVDTFSQAASELDDPQP